MVVIYNNKTYCDWHVFVCVVRTRIYRSMAFVWFGDAWLGFLSFTVARFYNNINVEEEEEEEGESEYIQSMRMRM